MQTFLQIRRAAYFPLLFVVVLWLVKLLEWVLDFPTGMYGIRPRDLGAFYSILTGPLIHGSMEHLVSNSVPLIVLGWLLFLSFPRFALRIFILIYVITGMLVWIGGRNSFHIGASGIVYGLATFLAFTGIFRKDISSIAIALVVAFLYGGMIWGVLPYQPGISWESHLLGGVTGVLLAIIYGKPEKSADTEEEEAGKSFKDFMESTAEKD